MARDTVSRQGKMADETQPLVGLKGRFLHFFPICTNLVSMGGALLQVSVDTLELFAFHKVGELFVYPFPDTTTLFMKRTVFVSFTVNKFMKAEPGSNFIKQRDG